MAKRFPNQHRYRCDHRYCTRGVLCFYDFVHTADLGTCFCDRMISQTFYLKYHQYRCQKMQVSISFSSHSICAAIFQAETPLL